MKEIRVIITGGTFDKVYDELQGELTFKDTHLPEILEQVRCAAPVALEINQLVDSLHMREMNRIKILRSCRDAKEECIVITHGTDTMCDTAQLLGREELPKTIVLTGAMVPFVFQHSDAVFNLGGSISAVQTLPHGVYIVMNGQVFNWYNVLKNKEKGMFETKEKI